MKITVCSDLHGKLPDIEESELLLIVGDISTEHNQKHWFTSVFLDWVESLPVNAVYALPGNHDYYLEELLSNHETLRSPSDKLQIVQPGVIYSYVSDNGESVSIGGNPYCTKLRRGAFLENDPDKLDELYSLIPERVDILLTHAAPKIKKLGKITDKSSMLLGKDLGDGSLVKHILRVSPKYVFCGHIHSGDHSLIEYKGIKCANVSLLNEGYKRAYNPFVFNL